MLGGENHYIQRMSGYIGPCIIRGLTKSLLSEILSLPKESIINSEIIKMHPIYNTFIGVSMFLILYIYLYHLVYDFSYCKNLKRNYVDFNN